MNCRLIQNLEIAEGVRSDFAQLSCHHYRDCSISSYAAIFSIKAKGKLAILMNNKAVGVIIYTMPSPSLSLRSTALNNHFTGLDIQSKLSVINKNIRTISRVIIDPRFRGLGLAVKLVAKTMPKLNVPIIEAMAVMGLVNPFFEKAGMTAYKAPMTTRCIQMIEALAYIGVDEDEFINAEKIQHKINNLSKHKAAFIENQIRQFIKSYVKRRNMPAGIERTRYVLSRLTARPVYYVWFNKKFEKLR